MDLKQKLMMTPLYDWLGKRSYAQSGEDIVVDIELGKKKKGFYVDIGAYHPKMFSNTYLFYKKGWSGLCVDPNPKMEELFRKARPRDKFLNLGVGVREDVREYFEFEDGAANTFSAEQAKKNQEEAGRKLKGKRMVAVLPLKTIFDKYLPKGQKIDLLSVDVEGMDLEVLRSNDWKKYRPEIIIAEDLEFDFDRYVNGVRLPRSQARPRNDGGVGIVKFLGERGYKLKDKTPYSLIFSKEKPRS